MTPPKTPQTVAAGEADPRLSPRHEFLLESQHALSTMSLGADMERRMIFLVGEIDEEMLYRFMTIFKLMDQEEGPIAIFLASPGGSLYAGYAMYDILRTAQNPTVIQGIGLIMSMASVILQAGTLRFLTPECRVMVHNASMGIEGHLQGVSSAVSDTKYLNERMVNIVAERMKRTPAYVKELFSNETYFSAKEAVDAGLADAVTSSRNIPLSYEEALAQINMVLPKEYQLATQASLTSEPQTPVLVKTKKSRKKKAK